jgi:hypothetical protein
VTHAVTGMTRQEADPIVRSLVEKFKDSQKVINPGQPFDKAYNVETLKPSDEWQLLYDQTCDEIENDYGLVLS